MDNNTAAAQALGLEIMEVVGAENFFQTDAAQTSIVFNREGIDITMAFGRGALNIYSTADESIRNVVYDANTRSLSFEMDEKGVDGNLTGHLLKISLEKTAIDNVQNYGGSIKRFEGEYMTHEGKVSMEFENQ